LLKLSMGESASLVLEGQRVLPKRLLAAGLTFRFASLDQALRHLLG
jgi:NAD dependent epimerase/dehydratase family enzyme